MNAGRTQTTQTAQVGPCAACGCPMPQAVDCVETGPANWLLELECPNCEALSAVLVDEGGLDAFEDESELGLEELVIELRALSLANMADDVDRLIAAINADALLPVDF